MHIPNLTCSAWISDGTPPRSRGWGSSIPGNGSGISKRRDGDNKAWYTEDAGIASGLLKYADDLAKAAIKGTIQQEARAVGLHPFHCSGRDSPAMRSGGGGIMPPPEFLMM